MKYILLTCCLLAATLGHATAQIVKGDFVKKTDELSAFFSQKNITGEDRAYEELNSMMKSQISFINSNIRTEQVKYVSDTTKAGEAKRSAEAELAKATAEINSGADAQGLKDVDIAEHKIAAAKNDIHKAHIHLENIDNYNNKLTTEMKALNEIKELKANIAANGKKIIADLNQFATTL